MTTLMYGVSISVEKSCYIQGSKIENLLEIQFLDFWFANLIIYHFMTICSVQEGKETGRERR
jgi:hypothetical protein